MTEQLALLLVGVGVAAAWPLAAAASLIGAAIAALIVAGARLIDARLRRGRR